ncbi:MAG: diadenylate cyclase CdaA [Phycisphaerales bacterium]|nr:diadenylate cyclase CdaA [Phycisphaerales bacterium]|tara:strand:- start:2133 stop:2972 length:840 start_codon:yes stop_codon:yes gene_type:complete
MLNNPFQQEAFWEILIELAVIWIVVYLVFRFLQGTRGAGVIRGLGFLGVLLMVLWLVMVNTESFGRLQLILNYFVGVLAILLIVIFQPELRQAAIRIGQTKFIRWGGDDQDQSVEAITEAVEFLSRNQFGAIIAVERNVQLGGLVEGGQHIDAAISSRLIESIFWPSSPLHDLGVVVRGNRILAAGVQFPLAEEGSLSANFGSRHRAALGMSRESDCVVVVVSEETGTVSIGVDGQLETRLEAAQVREALQKHLSGPGEEPTTAESEDAEDGGQTETQA